LKLVYNIANLLTEKNYVIFIDNLRAPGSILFEIYATSCRGGATRGGLGETIPHSSQRSFL